jgi:starch synthase
VTYYFIDNEYYFKRERLYGYFDDAERFAYFSKAVIDTMLFLKQIPDIIHCNDWQTSLVSIYLRTLYYHEELFKNVKTIFTIHNIEYQGRYSFDDDIIEDVFGISVNDSYLLEYHHTINLMKGAMESSNCVTTVSPTYAEEILTSEYAHELEEETNRVKAEGKLVGILNGIDKDFYNPKKDTSLFANYDAKDFSNKVTNKVELQKMLGLPVNDKVCLIGMVTRLVSHKGLDILKGAFERLMQENCQFVLIGTGDATYEGFLQDMQRKYSSKCRAIIAFNQDLSRKIYAASDLFLMPSKAEPCGLSQMIASRYGAIAMVRSTGGLKDSIIDFKEKNGCGYTFKGTNSNDLYEMIKRALTDYEDKETWAKKVRFVMDVDFSWNQSAKRYLSLYQNILESK